MLDRETMVLALFSGVASGGTQFISNTYHGNDFFVGVAGAFTGGTFTPLGAFGITFAYSTIDGITHIFLRR